MFFHDSDTFPGYDELDPGIRDLVRFLRERHGFNTTDSGDGSKAATMDCAMPFPHVVIKIDGDDVIAETRRVHDLMLGYGGGPWRVELTWSPDEPAFVFVYVPPADDDVEPESEVVPC